jgi:hypothetical protein
MNGLSDSLTIGLVLALVFGALFFYLYSRLGQAEKRVSLTENILLDLKMATENTMMAMATASHGNPHEYEHEHIVSSSASAQVDRVEAVGMPEPVEKEEVEQIPDEEFYKQVLEQAPTAPSSNRVEPNYESMTLKELKAEAKRQGIAVSSGASKKEVVDALKKQGSTASVFEGSDGVLEEGFPVSGE